MARKRFRRINRSDKKLSRPDKRGTVQVRITLMYDSAPVKGNLTRSFSLRDARVSEVFNETLRHLCGGR